MRSNDVVRGTRGYKDSFLLWLSFSSTLRVSRMFMRNLCYCSRLRSLYLISCLPPLWPHSKTVPEHEPSLLSFADSYLPRGAVAPHQQVTVPLVQWRNLQQMLPTSHLSRVHYTRLERGKPLFEVQGCSTIIATVVGIHNHFQDIFKEASHRHELPRFMRVLLCRSEAAFVAECSLTIAYNNTSQDPFPFQVSATHSNSSNFSFRRSQTFGISRMRRLILIRVGVDEPQIRRQTKLTPLDSACGSTTSSVVF